MARARPAVLHTPRQDNVSLTTWEPRWEPRLLSRPARPLVPSSRGTTHTCRSSHLTSAHAPRSSHSFAVEDGHHATCMRIVRRLRNVDTSPFPSLVCGPQTPVREGPSAPQQPQGVSGHHATLTHRARGKLSR